ncbi:hypothetical protein OIE68_36185 [Nocardia vinacea]|uniref:hypothetical protein n=1 Tax=Nocardia vinacea TaxID=96468 RepID=UPI002E12152A|nr:hypothetical protein OIE68_36185 [Nocardia vinacea]
MSRVNEITDNGRESAAAESIPSAVCDIRPSAMPTGRCPVSATTHIDTIRASESVYDVQDRRTDWPQIRSWLD